jgi:hypothetical protein
MDNAAALNFFQHAAERRGSASTKGIMMLHASRREVGAMNSCDR